jgi:hypothetical protein
MQLTNGRLVNSSTVTTTHLICFFYDSLVAKQVVVFQITICGEKPNYRKPIKR